MNLKWRKRSYLSWFTVRFRVFEIMTKSFLKAILFTISSHVLLRRQNLFNFSSFSTGVFSLITWLASAGWLVLFAYRGDSFDRPFDDQCNNFDGTQSLASLRTVHSTADPCSGCREWTFSLVEDENLVNTWLRRRNRLVFAARRRQITGRTRWVVGLFRVFRRRSTVSFVLKMTNLTKYFWPILTARNSASSEM